MSRWGGDDGWGGEDEGWKLPGIPCPKCKKLRCVYNGNYFCKACDWALPDEVLTKAEMYWFGAAYLTVMRVMGRAPDLDQFEQIMTKGH